MVFNTYRDLMNYVISHYPYEKILTYCHDLNYKLCFVRNSEIVEIREPKRWDIIRFLTCALSNFVAWDLSSNHKQPTEDDRKLCNIDSQFVNLYFQVRRGCKNSLIITFDFGYYGHRFKKYSLLYKNAVQGNPRTKVIFRFVEKEELI